MAFIRDWDQVGIQDPGDLLGNIHTPKERRERLHKDLYPYRAAGLAISGHKCKMQRKKIVPPWTPYPDISPATDSRQVRSNPRWPGWVGKSPLRDCLCEPIPSPTAALGARQLFTAGAVLRVVGCWEHPWLPPTPVVTTKNVPRRC